MNVLFLHGNIPDYLAEGLFHGLRKLLGDNCVDVPRYDNMYAPLSEGIRGKLRGHGFTLFGLLNDLPELADRRFYWQADLKKYDLVVIGNIWHQWHDYWEVLKSVGQDKVVILDGADHSSFFPFSSLLWRLKNYPWSYLAPVRKAKYFKRELMGGGYTYGLNRFLPSFLYGWEGTPRNAVPISFSIPEEKIIEVGPEAKVKQFTHHIVDDDVASRMGAFYSATGSDKYVFTTEGLYYSDLQRSRFGITTKRAGWDCLRHYELAANGAVLCFKDLDKKPRTCAPHGLDKSNCIIYHNYDDLVEKLTALNDDDYAAMLDRTYSWARSNTTVVRAKEFLRGAVAVTEEFALAY